MWLKKKPSSILFTLKGTSRYKKERENWSFLWSGRLRVPRRHCSSLGHCCGTGSIPTQGFPCAASTATKRRETMGLSTRLIKRPLCSPIGRKPPASLGRLLCAPAQQCSSEAPGKTTLGPHGQRGSETTPTLEMWEPNNSHSNPAQCVFCVFP